jgi:hypothetical protein
MPVRQRKEVQAVLFGRDRSPILMGKPPSRSFDGAEKRHPKLVSAGRRGFEDYGELGECLADTYEGDQRVAWLIGFYEARTRERVRAMREEEVVGNATDGACRGR